MMYQYGYYSPFHFIGSFIGWLFFFIVILVILKALKKDHFMDKMHKHGFGRDSAMDLLRERYAKGEINKEEFESKKKDLS